MKKVVKCDFRQKKMNRYYGVDEQKIPATIIANIDSDDDIDSGDNIDNGDTIDNGR
jgi:hypothetical protein